MKKKTVSEPQERDIINVIISDTHAGSDRAIFPPSITLPPLMADEKERVLIYSNNQSRIYDHFIWCAEYINKTFPNHKKIVTHNGDAIEGLHHYTIQLSAPTIDDHVLIHEAVMDDFLSALGFTANKGDELNYISGTESHTQYTESRIAKHFEYHGAKFFDEFKTVQNGKELWFVHQWASPGDGANEGSPIHGKLKALYYNCKREERKMPDVVISSHFHKSAMASFTDNWKTYYGMVTPSLQMKTRYAQKAAPFQRNDIGISLIEVSKSGLMEIHKPLLMKG